MEKNKRPDPEQDFKRNDRGYPTGELPRTLEPFVM